MFEENVLIDPFQMLNRMWLSPNINRCVLLDDEASHLVKSEGVIDMIMCKEDAVTPRDTSTKHLLTKVWRSVDQDDTIVAVGVNPTHRCAGTKALVSWIVRGTCGAITPNRGHAGGCSRPKHNAANIGNHALAADSA